MEHEEARDKFERYIRGKYPNFADKEVEEIAAQFSELALFLIRLSLKRRNQLPTSDSDIKGRET